MPGGYGFPEESLYPPPPLSKDVTGHYELAGPEPAPVRFGQGRIRYQIIDRRNRRKPVLVLYGDQDDRDILKGVAETTFGEFKRRLLYHAGQDWQQEVDAIRQRAAS